MSILLQVKNITKIYPNQPKPGLDNISFEVAQGVFMSERTVSNHLQHIFEKLEVSSAVEAVTKAIQLGYIPPL